MRPQLISYTIVTLASTYETSKAGARNCYRGEVSFTPQLRLFPHILCHSVEEFSDVDERCK
jgi:hypothetical protein